MVSNVVLTDVDRCVNDSDKICNIYTCRVDCETKLEKRNTLQTIPGVGNSHMFKEKTL